MYKVFIDNHILFITTSIKNIPVSEYEIVEYSEFVKRLPDLYNSSEALHFVVLASTISDVFNLIFKDYEKITAAGGLVRKGSRYLFIKRNGFWDIPKGKIEANEEIRKAAVREIEEECGITNPVVERELCQTLHTYHYKGTPVLKTTYWYALTYDKQENLIPQTEEGITEVRWFQKDEFSEILSNTYPSIKDVLAML